MNNEEIKALTPEELKEKISSEQEALRKLKFAHKVSAIENPMKIKETRKLIARLKTNWGARQTKSI
jgi:large subunit ribosomal protein L29